MTDLDPTIGLTYPDLTIGLTDPDPTIGLTDPDPTIGLTYPDLTIGLYRYREDEDVIFTERFYNGFKVCFLRLKIEEEKN